MLKHCINQSDPSAPPSLWGNLFQTDAFKRYGYSDDDASLIIGHQLGSNLVVSLCLAFHMAVSSMTDEANHCLANNHFTSLRSGHVALSRSLSKSARGDRPGSRSRKAANSTRRAILALHTRPAVRSDQMEASRAAGSTTPRFAGRRVRRAVYTKRGARMGESAGDESQRAGLSRTESIATRALSECRRVVCEKGGDQYIWVWKAVRKPGSSTRKTSDDRVFSRCPGAFLASPILFLNIATLAWAANIELPAGETALPSDDVETWQTYITFM